MGKPAQLKVLQGTFRGDRDSHGAKVDMGLPECPAWMPKEAKKYWNKIGPELVNCGLISLVDSAAFSAHCDSMGKYEQVMARMVELDDMLDATPQGYQVQSALFTVRNKLWDQIIKSSGEFGLTPAARSKVKASDKQASLDFGGWENI